MLKYHNALTSFIERRFVNSLSLATSKVTSKLFSKMCSFVWIDMEMSGLDPAQHTIIELACIVSTPELEPVHEGINIIIHQPDDVLTSMNPWCLKHHNESGLTELSRKSNISLSEADQLLSKYIDDHSTGTKYMAGNSVYMDKMFLMKYLPKTDKLLHYRILDVSSVKILCGSWYPCKFLKLSEKKATHRALADIKESIQELKNYREEIFKSISPN